MCFKISSGKRFNLNGSVFLLSTNSGIKSPIAIFFIFIFSFIVFGDESILSLKIFTYLQKTVKLLILIFNALAIITLILASSHIFSKSSIESLNNGLSLTLSFNGISLSSLFNLLSYLAFNSFIKSISGEIFLFVANAIFDIAETLLFCFKFSKILCI